MEADLEDEELFLHDLPDYLRCSICLCCLDNPYQTPCGHRFCKGCIMPLVHSVNNFCPQDRTEIDAASIFPDNAVKLQINNLRIRCPKSQHGCRWEGELWDKSNHLHKCSYAPVPCPQCAALISKTKMEAHLPECPQRRVQCEYCQEEVTHSDLCQHHDACHYFPVPCPHKCQTVPIPRRDMEKHLGSECPKVEVVCSLAPYGCEEKVERASLGEHLVSCGPKYAADMAGMLLTLRSEVSRLRVTVDTQDETLRLLESTVYPCSGQFTWKVEDIVRRIRDGRKGDPASAVLYSPPFFSSEAGYKLCLCIYPAGDSHRDYLSLYFVILQGPYDHILPWPFQRRAYLALLNCRHGHHVSKDITPDPQLHYFHKPVSARNVGYGYPKFIALSRVLSEDSEFVGGGAIFFRCAVFNLPAQ